MAPRILKRAFKTNDITEIVRYFNDRFKWYLETPEYTFINSQGAPNFRHPPQFLRIRPFLYSFDFIIY